MEGALSLPQTLLAIEKEPPEGRMDILETALEKECKAYDLYQRMKDKVEPSLGEIFQALAEQERRHIGELSSLL